MKMLLSVLRGHNSVGFEASLSPETLDLDSLLPFRHKIERDYGQAMRSSFARMNIGIEHVATENDLMYYQL